MRPLRIVKQTSSAFDCARLRPEGQRRVIGACFSGQMEIVEKQKRLSLLLVDDDAELCGMMREFFDQAGHCLDCAYNGREGLAAAQNGTYDLVILDVMLPVLDGFEVLKQLRASQGSSGNHADSPRSAAGPHHGPQYRSR